MIRLLFVGLWGEAAVAQEWEVEADRAQWKDDAWHLENLHMQVGEVWHLHAAAGEGAPTDGFHLSEASLSPCLLDRRYFSVDAAEVWLHEDVARWRGAWFVVADKPLVPLPRGRAALEGARIRPGLPQVGWEEGLPRGVWPVELRLSDATAVQLAAGWWGEPLLRAGWEQRDVGGVEATGTLGDEPGAGATGSLSWKQEVVRLGVAGQWASDREWLERHGTSILDRQRPFTEQRAVLGWRDFQAYSVSWQPLPGPSSWRPGLSWTRPVFGLGPLQGGALAAVDGDGLGLRGEGGVHLGAYESVGALELEARGDVRGHGFFDGGHSALDAGGSAAARLPFWGQHGSWRHEFLVGWWGGGAERVSETGAPRGPRDAASPGWETGPVLESQWFGPVGLRARALFPLQEAPRFDVRVRASGFQGGAWGTGAGTEAGGWVTLGDAAGGLQTEVFWSESLVGRIAAHAGLPLGLVPGVQARVVDRGIEEATASLGWSLPCQCLSLGGAATLAADRDTPEIGLWLRAGPLDSSAPIFRPWDSPLGTAEAMQAAQPLGGTHAILPPVPGPWPDGMH